MGSWGHNDLIFFEDVLAAMKSSSKRKRDSSDIEIVVQTISNHFAINTYRYRGYCGFCIILWVSYYTVKFSGQLLPVPATGMVCHGMGTVWQILTHRLPI